MGAGVPETKIVYSAASGLPTDSQTLNSSGTVTADVNTTYDDFGEPLPTPTLRATPPPTPTTPPGGHHATTAKGTETFTYTAPPGTHQITDSQAGTFTATYNPDGNLRHRAYPDGITGTYTIRPDRNRHLCRTTAPQWNSLDRDLTDTITPDASGDWASEAITDTAIPVVSQQSYTYDNADRLTERSTPATASAPLARYTYDRDSNRTSLTTAAPGVRRRLPETPQAP